MLAAGPVWSGAPERVVSMNLCTDQVALMLAAPGQLVSVTQVSADPLSSVMADRLEGYHLNAGRAEEIYALSPDLVLANEWSDPVAVGLLRGLGIEVIQYPVIERLDQIAGFVRDVGAVLGREEAAEALAREVETRLAALPPPGDKGPLAAVFFANGYTLGAGTLSHDIVTRAGFQNLAERLGRSGGGAVSLEELVMHGPDLIVTGRTYPGASRSEAVTLHPAVMAVPRVETGPEWVCGTPFALDALDRMVAARQALGNATTSP